MLPLQVSANFLVLGTPSCALVLTALHAMLKGFAALVIQATFKWKRIITLCHLRAQVTLVFKHQNGTTSAMHQSQSYSVFLIGSVAKDLASTQSVVEVGASTAKQLQPTTHALTRMDTRRIAAAA